MDAFVRTTRLGVAFALVASVVFGVPSVAVAQQHSHARAVPSTPTRGFTGGELVGESWAGALATPVGTPGSCVQLAGGKVLSPNEGIACRVPPGTPVFINFSVENSNLEPPFSSDEETQLAEARNESNDLVVSLDTTVDNGVTTDIRDPRYAVSSPQMRVRLPADNVFGVPAQTISFTAFGWAATISGLTPGRHDIHVDNVLDFDGDIVTFPIDYVVDVG